MKQFLLFLLIQTLIYGENIDTNSSDTLPDQQIIIEDNSGLTDDEVRNVAKETDTYNEKNQVSISKVIEAVDEKGKVDVSQLRSSWEELSPTPEKYDWVQTKSGEWFKGEIKAMYDDSLEFDSDEIGLYTFDFEDIVQIKSYNIMSTNIENLASFPGVLRFKDNNLTIIQGDQSFNFTREQIISLAKSGDSRLNYWSGKITLNMDIRSGNKNQFDYTAQGYITRRTAESRLRFDYLGRVSSVEDVETSENVETANDHRINEKYDIYLTRHFFWTPIFSEYYHDKFQNIESQYTVGAGIGYTLIKRKKLEWDISTGLAYKATNYDTVSEGEETSVSSPSLELSSIIEYELSKKIDITLNAKMTFTNEENGQYNHHIVLTIDNEILSWLDFNIALIGDRTEKPTEDTDGNIPEISDYQLLLGLGIEF